MHGIQISSYQSINYVANSSAEYSVIVDIAPKVSKEQEMFSSLHTYEQFCTLVDKHDVYANKILNLSRIVV